MADGNLGWPAPESAPLTSQAQHREANCHPMLAWGVSPRCGLYLGPGSPSWVQTQGSAPAGGSQSLAWLQGCAPGTGKRLEKGVVISIGPRSSWKPAAGEEQVRRPAVGWGCSAEAWGTGLAFYRSLSYPPPPPLRFPVCKTRTGTAPTPTELVVPKTFQPVPGKPEAVLVTIALTVLVTIRGGCALHVVVQSLRSWLSSAPVSCPFFTFIQLRLLQGR